MEDQTFFALAAQLNKLSGQYTSGSLRHDKYVAEFDKTLAQYKVSKKDLAAEVEKRTGKKL